MSHRLSIQTLLYLHDVRHTLSVTRRAAQKKHQGCKINLFVHLQMSIESSNFTSRSIDYHLCSVKQICQPGWWLVQMLSTPSLVHYLSIVFQHNLRCPFLFRRDQR